MDILAWESSAKSGHNLHPVTMEISRKEKPGGNSGFRNRGWLEMSLFPCKHVWMYFLLFRAPFIALASAPTTPAKINICWAFSPFRSLGKRQVRWGPDEVSVHRTGKLSNFCITSVAKQNCKQVSWTQPKL